MYTFQHYWIGDILHIPHLKSKVWINQSIRYIRNKHTEPIFMISTRLQFKIVFINVFANSIITHIHHQHTAILITCMITSRHKMISHIRINTFFMNETPRCTIGNTIITIIHKFNICKLMTRHAHVRIGKISAHRILNHTEIFLPYHIPTTTKSYSRQY